LIAVVAHLVDLFPEMTGDQLSAAMQEAMAAGGERHVRRNVLKSA
jgi:hypothetical protein